MKRVLIDYRKLSRPIASLLIDAYPYGYGDEDIISFINSKGEVIEAVELQTEEILYLIKISNSLVNFMANFEESFEKELIADDSNAAKDAALDTNLDLAGQEEMEFD